MEPDAIRQWLRVHTLQLAELEGGTDDRELLLTLGAAPPRLAGMEQPHQAHARQLSIVLGPTAAAILLRLLLDKGVQPAQPGAGEVHLQ